MSMAEGSQKESVDAGVADLREQLNLLAGYL